MEKSTKRGKIPQSDWPSIMARYEAGETLSSIARTYDCSPPAISYVVSRSRARQPSEAAPAASEPEAQLVKTAGHAAPPPPAASLELRLAPPGEGDSPPTLASRDFPVEQQHSPHPTAGPVGAPSPSGPPTAGAVPNGTIPHSAPHNGANPNGDARRTLHLSLGGPPGTGSLSRAEQPITLRNGAEPQRTPPLAEAPAEIAPLVSGLRAAAAPPNGNEIAEDARPYQAAPRPNGNGGAGNETALYIDRDLRARVDGDIAAFLAAFDAALLQDSPESRSQLREATDRLLRAGARTRIELERLEARVPLTPRDHAGRGAADWRQRY